MRRPQQLIVCALVALFAAASSAQQNPSASTDKAEIRHLMDVYMRAIDAADPAMAQSGAISASAGGRPPERNAMRK